MDGLLLIKRLAGWAAELPDQKVPEESWNAIDEECRRTARAVVALHVNDQTPMRADMQPTSREGLLLTASHEDPSRGTFTVRLYKFQHSYSIAALNSSDSPVMAGIEVIGADGVTPLFGTAMPIPDLRSREIIVEAYNIDETVAVPWTTR